MSEVKNKNAEGFVEFLAESKITPEKQPVIYTDKNFAIVVLHDKIEATGYVYRWELVFDPNNCLVNINTMSLVAGVTDENTNKVLTVINEKNKNTMWGKFFLLEGAVHSTAPLFDRSGDIEPSDVFDVLKLIRFSVEELHKEVLKELL